MNKTVVIFIDFRPGFGEIIFLYMFLGVFLAQKKTGSVVQ